MKKKLSLIIIMLIVLSISSFAATTEITEKFSHKLGPFENSKDYNHVINMPFNSCQSGICIHKQISGKKRRCFCQK